MKAAIYDRYGGADKVRLADLEMPTPGKGELLVKVLACAVNLSDWERLTGSPLWVRMVAGYVRPKKRVLGSDIVGIVEKLGEGVSGFEIGQRVMGDYIFSLGGFAEYACLPAQDTVVVPDALSDEIAACLPQAGGIAASGTEGVSQRDRLLINGAGGGSGTMALQLAKAAGAHVTAVDNTKKVGWLTSLGADEVFDYTEVNFTQCGKQWNKILDMVATRGPCELPRALFEGGTYRAVGGGFQALIPITLGGKLVPAKRSIGILSVASGRALTHRVVRLALDGRIKPLIEAVLPLSSVPEALDRTGRGFVLGKLVIKP